MHGGQVRETDLDERSGESPRGLVMRTGLLDRSEGYAMRTSLEDGLANRPREQKRRTRREERHRGQG